MTTILPSRAATWFGPLMIAGGVIAVAVGVWSAFESAEPSWVGRLLQAAFPVLMGMMFTAGGHMLAGRRGGVMAGTGGLSLQGDSDADRLSVPAHDVVALVGWEQTERWGEEHEHQQWVLEAVHRTGARVLLGESTDEHGLKHVGHQVAVALDRGPLSEALPAEAASRPVGDPPSGVVPAADGVTVSVGARGSLIRTLAISGVAMLVVGVVLLMDIANNNVFGFLFGPLLALLGLVLIGLPLVKAYLVEEVRLFDGEIGHGYRAFGLKWGWRTLPLDPAAYVRIRQRGLLGAGIEIITEGRVLHVASGVHRRTHLHHEGLLWLAGYLAWLLGQRRRSAG